VVRLTIAQCCIRLTVLSVRCRTNVATPQYLWPHVRRGLTFGRGRAQIGADKGEDAKRNFNQLSGSLEIRPRQRNNSDDEVGK